MKPKEMARRLPADNPRVAAAKACGRSRVTNGKVLIAGVDGRGRQARRWRDLYHGFLSETDGKHDELARQTASLIVAREQLDARLANGEPVDALALVRLSGAISRCLVRMGLCAPEPDDAREPVDVTDKVIERMREAAP